MDNAADVKKPVLFYYEEGVCAWVPAPELVSNIVDITYLHAGTDDESVIRFKSFMMSDNDLLNLPED